MEFKLRTEEGEELLQVNRQTSVEQVVSEFCERNGGEGDFRLTYKNKALDPSLKLYYSGLPVGTLLAIEKCDQSAKPVSVLLQVEHLCFSGKFELEDNLWMVLTELCPSDMLESFVYPLVTYTQNEIRGVENIKNTFLKSLDDSSNKISVRLAEVRGKSNSSNSKSSVKSKVVPRVGSGKASTSNTFSGLPEPLQRKSPNDTITYLGERKALIFSMPDQSEPMEDIADEFFEPSPDDIKNLYQELQRSRQDLEEKPLLTRALRQQQEAENLQKKLNKYKYSVLRICFPDRLVLQGVFRPLETVKDVAEFVSNYLQDPDMKFVLYLTPPKIVLSSEKRLIDVQCVPSAKIYFSSQDGALNGHSFLKEDLLGKVTTYSVANDAVALLNQKSCRSEASIKPGPNRPLQMKDMMSVPMVQQHPPPGTIRKTPKDQVPKWFRQL